MMYVLYQALEGLESVGKDFRHLMSKALTVKFGTGYSYSRSSALARESLVHIYICFFFFMRMYI